MRGRRCREAAEAIAGENSGDRNLDGIGMKNGQAGEEGTKRREVEKT